MVSGWFRIPLVLFRIQYLSFEIGDVDNLDFLVPLFCSIGHLGNIFCLHLVMGHICGEKWPGNRLETAGPTPFLSVIWGRELDTL